MINFFHTIRVNLWSIVAELEYILYPWKLNTPPQWAIKKYNLDSEIGDPLDENNNVYYYDWIKSQNEKINKIEENIIYLTKEIELLKNER